MERENLTHGFRVFINNDPGLRLETNSFLKRLFNLFFIPIINNLPKGFKHKIKKTDRSAKEVIENVTTHNALEVLYSSGKLFSTRNLMNSIFQKIWFNMDNSKAVRNRLKFVISELKKHLQEIAKFDREINIISIASGSSRAIIEAVENAHYLKGTRLSLTFLDKSKDAIEYSKKLATRINHLPIQFEWINDTAGSFLRNPPDKKFDVVEIVGLMDYFNDEKLVETFKGILSVLKDGGIVITANINHNKEEKFVSDILEWVMIYRTAEELAQLLIRAGFDEKKMRVYYEPLKLHTIIVAKK